MPFFCTCIFLTGGVYTPYSPCMSTPLRGCVSVCVISELRRCCFCAAERSRVGRGWLSNAASRSPVTWTMLCHVAQHCSQLVHLCLAKQLLTDMLNAEWQNIPSVADELHFDKIKKNFLHDRFIRCCF